MNLLRPHELGKTERDPSTQPLGGPSILRLRGATGAGEFPPYAFSFETMSGKRERESFPRSGRGIVSPTGWSGIVSPAHGRGIVSPVDGCGTVSPVKDRRPSVKSSVP